MNETALLHDTPPHALDARLLAEDDSDECACAPIPPADCTEEPNNYGLNLLSGALVRLGEQIASPSLVLPWLLAGIGASATVIGLLVPLKQAGSALAQLAGSARVRAQAQRKWVWVGAALFQALMLTIVGASALVLPPEMAGPLTLMALAVFAVAGGVGSLALQDVLGKTLPVERRARLFTRRALIGAALVVAVAVVFRELVGDIVSARVGVPLVAVPLVGLAALCWALAALVFTTVAERHGATEGGRSVLGELPAGLALLQAVPGYRRFLLARVLLLGVELAAPFYALHASRLYGNGAGPLALYIIALAVAQPAAGPLWGRWAAASGRTVMTAAGLLAALAGGLALGLAWVPTPDGLWGYAGVFLLLGLAEGGVRLGRKAYLLAAAPETERPLYAGFANAVAGLLALVGGGLGVLVDFSSPIVAIDIVIALAALGALAALRLPKAPNLAGSTPAPPRGA